MIFRNPLGETGQPACHEDGRSARETFWIFAENFGGPAGVGEGGGVGVLGAAVEGEADASVWKAAGDDVTTPVPPQAVRPSTATATIADLGFRKEAIRAEYPSHANPRRCSDLLVGAGARPRDGFCRSFSRENLAHMFDVALQFWPSDRTWVRSPSRQVRGVQ
ncbi:hypothetical protein GCM10023194_78440 [Planotetraspora phitsanulokensis]|uniref:Uncharacterized protein n=1 Tax=Planotetraspora phitsanulokensis TaxID=575192 RepID=A0A8J3ULX3_9ACTN|nr:hypothetical protein Pph01_61330 [Planotetraspora phitsanulokensis]